MPSKYVIHTKQVSNRFRSPSKSGIIAWEEGCLKCPVCVKKRCVYKVYERRDLDTGQMMDSLDNECMNCLRCVQGCPKELIHKSVNPDYAALGDSYWTQETITRLWYQAQTGKIPVSGAGYSGPFSGPGFDSMWTDMSEIVRPTRDGIHGREYISTAVDIGRAARSLAFDKKGDLRGSPPDLINVPLPILMRLPAFGAFRSNTIRGWAMAAKKTGTFLALPEGEITSDLDRYRDCLIPMLSPGMTRGPSFLTHRLLELGMGKGLYEEILKMGRSRAGAPVPSVRLPFKRGVEAEIVSLVKGGAPVVHLEGTLRGKAVDDETLFLKDGIRLVHLALVEEGVRDETTLLASGGIALAEHVAKAIICGADAVFVDLPIQIALECRVCRRCTAGLDCPVSLGDAPAPWVAARVVNLLGAWHNQLLEVMGAMGIRDVRRLRGEAGRAMFFEELDRTTFGAMGEVREGYELV